MFRLFLTACLFVFCGIQLCAQDSSDAFIIQKILKRYTDTYGDLREANKLTAVTFQGVQIQDGIEYPFLVRKKRPSSIRYRLEKGEVTFVTGYNGEDGWLQTSNGEETFVESLSGDQLKAIKREARFEGPLCRHLEKPENRITLSGHSWVGGRESYVLEITEAESVLSRYFLDVRNSHVLQVDQLNEEGVAEFQTIYRDYRDVKGYPFAHEIENRIGGETVSIVRIDSILVNPGVLSFYFEMPQS
ncbi:MAG: hypothetical protein AAF065_08395 [Verrucomicrobiota bacterium]